MIYCISRRFIRAECLVPILSLRRCSKRPPDDNARLHYKQCSSVQNFFRTLTTTSCFRSSILHPPTSKVAEDILSHIETFGVDKDEISSHPELSKLPIEVIQLRLQFCSEGGITPSIRCVTEFENLVQKNPAELKSCGMLPNDTDVVERILSSVNFEGPPPLDVNRDESYTNIHFQTVCHCMKYVFGFSYPLWKRFFHASIVFSFDNIKSIMDFNIGTDWIRWRSSLICFANPYNLQRLSELERFYELPVTLNKIILQNSTLLVTNFEDVRSVFFILMKNRVCRHDLERTKWPETFLLNPHILDGLFKKIEMESNVNPLALMYKKHYIVRRKSRKGMNLDQRKLAQIYPVAPIDSLQESWQREMKLWLESKSNILEYKPCRHKKSAPSLSPPKVKGMRGQNSESLIGILASELKTTKSFVKSELSRIPLGLKVPGQEACETLTFLLDSGYSREEIKDSMQLLIYPRDVVRETLDLHVVSDPVYGVHRNRHLQLCLYHILLKYNYCLPDDNASGNHLIK